MESRGSCKTRIFKGGKLNMKNKQKNDNLSKYKESLQQRNKALIQRAISHIKKLGGEISMSNVSKVTYEIADIKEKEKGITLAGISKNPMYRALIDQASSEDRRQQGFQNIRGRAKRYSDGDIRMLLHTMRVENTELKRTNKILAHQLKEKENVIETSEPIEETLIIQYNEIRNTARAMVNRLRELELAYIDANTKTLRVMHYEEIIVPSEALELFYKKELDDIQREI